MAAGLTERVLGLIAFLDKRGNDGCTLTDITREVPGYGLVANLTVGTPEWETVRKRLQRDLQPLHAGFGISIDYDEQNHRYRLRAPFFTADERVALIAAAATVNVAGMDDEPVLGELGAAVDEREQRIVLTVPSRVQQLCRAIRDRSPVQFEYRGRTRVLDPYAVGRWRTQWYVAGREHESDAPRKFRIDRIEGDDATGSAIVMVGPVAGYAIPDEFDAVDEMRLDPNDWGTDPRVTAEIRVATDHLQNVQYELGGHVAERGDDFSVLELDVRHYAAFRDRLLGFGEHAIVIDPPELVALVRDHLMRIVEASA